MHSRVIRRSVRFRIRRVTRAFRSSSFRRPPVRRGAFLALLPVALASATGHAGLTLVNESQLDALATGMDRAGERVATVRAVLTSSWVTRRDGREPVETSTTTEWVSRGDAFRSQVSMRTLVVGRAPRPPAVGADGGLIAQRTSLNAFADGVALEYRPTARRALIRRPEDSVAHSRHARAGCDPRYFGRSVLGLSMRQVMAGMSWHRRPEDIEPQVRRTVRAAGPGTYRDREVEVVEIDVEWVGDGRQRGRFYRVLVDPQRGFTVPRVTGESSIDGGPRRPFETVETEIREYGDGIWGPVSSTYRVLLGSADANRGEAVLSRTVDQLAYNEPVADEDLRIALPDKTVVDDAIAGMIYTYEAGSDDEVIQGIIESMSGDGPPSSLDAVVPETLAARQQGGASAIAPAVTATVLSHHDGAGDWTTRVLLVAAGISILALAVIVVKRARRRIDAWNG